jgi:hypothetical protein
MLIARARRKIWRSTGVTLIIASSSYVVGAVLYLFVFCGIESCHAPLPIALLVISVVAFVVAFAQLAAGVNDALARRRRERT